MPEEIESEVRPWRPGAADPIAARRRELFRLAAPVFRQHGFRGSTIKALAHACHLGPAGLYHYFESKADLATYIVRRPHLDWRSVYVDPEIDPLVQLRGFLDLAIGELPDFILALDLAEEMALPNVARIRAAMFSEGEAVLGRYLEAVRPDLTPAAAAELGRLLLSLLLGSHEIGRGAAFDAVALRDRIVRVLRAELVPWQIEPERFDQVMAGRQT